MTFHFQPYMFIYHKTSHISLCYSDSSAYYSEPCAHQSDLFAKRLNSSCYFDTLKCCSDTSACYCDPLNCYSNQSALYSGSCAGYSNLIRMLLLLTSWYSDSSTCHLVYLEFNPT